VGIILEKKVGDQVSPGDAVATIYAGAKATEEQLNAVKQMISDAYSFQDEKVAKDQLILGFVE
jgi:pyrimidine-nucleoside phosphorylase